VRCVGFAVRRRFRRHGFSANEAQPGDVETIEFGFWEIWWNLGMRNSAGTGKSSINVCLNGKFSYKWDV
jgi:hypothetical protein